MSTWIKIAILIFAGVVGVLFLLHITKKNRNPKI